MGSPLEVCDRVLTQSNCRPDPSIPPVRAVSGGHHHRGVILQPMLADERAQCPPRRSEEHTSELQSLRHLVCRLLLEKKKIIYMLHVWSLMLRSVVVSRLPLSG